MDANTERLKVSLRLGLASLAIALGGAALIPATASAQFASFSNGVLTVHSSEGKVIPRCESDGTISVDGVTPDGGGTCAALREIDADSIANGDFDFSQLPADAGSGPCSITINAKSLITDPTDISDDKFIGDPNAVNNFTAGLGFDSLTGGNCNDTLNGGPDSDKIDGGAGNDTLRGGPGGDKLIGGLGNDSLFGGGGGDKLLGGPGRDVLKGGGGSDKLVGGPGKNVLQQ